MSNCIYCNSDMPEKTLGHKIRKFCNKSCARKYYISANKTKLSESANKGWSKKYDKLKSDPNYLKQSWSMTDKRLKAYSDMKNSDHYSDMSLLGKKAMVEKYGDYFIRETERKTKIKNGKWFDYSIFNYDDVKKYTRAVRRITRKIYGSAGKGYHWDHIVPISIGFKLSIAPDQLCRSENIKKLKSEQNLSKGSSLTEEAKMILKIWDIN